MVSAAELSCCRVVVNVVNVVIVLCAAGLFRPINTKALRHCVML
jgi:hypothetical protein